MQQSYSILIHHLFISPGHNYFGRPKFEAGDHLTFDVDAVEVRAGQGLVGDRFFGKGERFDGHVTFFAWEIFQALCAELSAPEALVDALRRNVVIEGVPLNGLIGHEFAIDGVRFFGAKHCAPCRWMEAQVALGALRFLRGRGGLRAQALSDGVLRRGPAVLTTEQVLDLTTVTQPLPTPKLP
jgi:hypothetical protein